MRTSSGPYQVTPEEFQELKNLVKMQKRYPFNPKDWLDRTIVRAIRLRPGITSEGLYTQLDFLHQDEDDIWECLYVSAERGILKGDADAGLYLTAKGIFIARALRPWQRVEKYVEGFGR